MLTEINVGGLSLSTYWMMFVFGTAAMSVMNYKRREKLGISKVLAVLLGVYTAISGLIGAKLMYIFENFSQVLENGITLGGVSFYGTVFFMPIAMLVAAAVLKKKRSQAIDFVTPPILLMLAFMRAGCFLNGCCGGISFDVCGLQIESIPTQLIELTMDVGIMCYLLKRVNKKLTYGELYYLFMIMYGIGRFMIEFIRIREISVLGMSNGQIFSVLSVFVGVTVYRFINTHKNVK